MLNSPDEGRAVESSASTLRSNATEDRSRRDGKSGKPVRENPARTGRQIGIPKRDGGRPQGPRTQFFKDHSKTVIARNDSPDVGFTASLNPYRGCEHGCIYCYARPTHEFLGFSAGLDFESKIMVKEDAPELLRAELMSPKWQPQVIFMSGVTDCYQPVEAKLKLTRRCLEVLVEFRNPVFIITKNRLVTRDIDLLSELARHQAAAVWLSITTLDAEIAQGDGTAHGAAVGAAGGHS